MNLTRFRWLIVLLCIPAMALAQMVTGPKMPGFADAFGLSAKPDIEVRQLSVEVGASTMVDVLQDGEQARLVFHVSNKSNEDIHASAAFRLVHYGTAVPLGDVWIPHVFKIADVGSTEVRLDIAKGAAQDVTVSPQVPAAYGGYAQMRSAPPTSMLSG